MDLHNYRYQGRREAVFVNTAIVSCAQQPIQILLDVVMHGVLHYIISAFTTHMTATQPHAPTPPFAHTSRQVNIENKYFEIRRTREVSVKLTDWETDTYWCSGLDQQEVEVRNWLDVIYIHWWLWLFITCETLTPNNDALCSNFRLYLNHPSHREKRAERTGRWEDG